ncbi:uncharacterized protein LOC135844396 isoform X1 [Planococcus citri]|uniref:uncharacterized protein LOC135844396 isoform X1 n=1 Tax=Planococcus citri TaxID=170843 RepID=UPI0031F8C5AA
MDTRAVEFNLRLIDEYKYVYPTNKANVVPINVPRLKKMASVEIAITLWNRATVVIPGMITNHDKWCSSLKEEVPKWIDALPIPKSLTIGIQKHFNEVKFNVAHWISYHWVAVCLERRTKRILYQHLDHLVWYPNDSVNFAETARNLLKSDKLADLEKYRLACTFCLREDVEKMWDILKQNCQLDKIRQTFFTICWKTYCQCEDFQKTVVLRVGGHFADIAIAVVDNWPAIEYFFDRLNTEWKVEKAIALIGEHGVRFQKSLLMKLDESQRSQVLTNKVVNIIVNYAKHDDFEEDAIATWYDFRDVITQDQFSALIAELLDYETEDFILTEIWSTARDEFKRHILDNNAGNFIRKAIEWLVRTEEPSLTFVSSVLLDHACVDIKREITKDQFFSLCCMRFIRQKNPAVELLDHLINLCLPEPVESTAFKLSLTKESYLIERCKTLMIDQQTQTVIKLLDFGYSKTDPTPTQLVRRLLKHLDPQCLIYYSTGDLNFLNDLLAPFTSSYPEIVADYKKELLLSQNGVQSCMNHFGSTNNMLDEIIADGLPAKSIAKLKNKIIFSPEGIDKLKNLIAGGLVSDAKKWIGWFLEANGSRKKLKARLFNCLKPDMNQFLRDLNCNSRNADDFFCKSEFYAEIFRFLGDENHDSRKCNSLFPLRKSFVYGFIRTTILFVIFHAFLNFFLNHRL